MPKSDFCFIFLHKENKRFLAINFTHLLFEGEDTFYLRIVGFLKKIHRFDLFCS